MPASIGVQGPGEITNARGLSLEPDNVRDADRVVPNDLCRLAKPVKIAGYVENKGIVIIDDYDQGAPDVSARNASKIRRALTSVSSYSDSGSDIAVIPPPA